MRHRLFVVAAVAALVITCVSAQTKDSNGGTFIGGPKYKKDKKPTARSLKGTVTDDSGKPLQGALVTLTNTVKKEKLTFITKQDGRYNFDDLAFNIDYEVQAQFRDLHSELKKVSQYDDKPDVVRILEVEPAATQR